MEAALGEAFGAEPKSLASVDQEFEGRAGAVAKDVDRAAQGILSEGLATHGGQPIDALTEIDGGQRDKDATLRSELQHQRLSRNVWTSGTSAELASP